MIAPEKAFVNSFWGQKEAGFTVIQGRIKHSLNTLQEILHFYKERIAIEKDYNKKLGRLTSNVTLGSNETGSLKVALDKFQAESATMVAQNDKFIKSVSQQNYDTLQRFQQVYQRNVSRMESHIQKILARKADYRQYLDTAKEKYKTACSQIKTLNLLCQTTWGKENDKHRAKLARIEQNLDGLRSNYQDSIIKYNEIHDHWVGEWRIALSSFYQLEIERIQICKLNGFSFCNHVASLCVDWDSAVDVSRSTFAKVGAPKDAYDFVEVYGTGNEIAMPPKYVDFMAGADDDDAVEYTTAGFTDPDFSQILNRTFSTMSGLRQEPEHQPAKTQESKTPTKSPTRTVQSPVKTVQSPSKTSQTPTKTIPSPTKAAQSPETQTGSPPKMFSKDKLLPVKPKIAHTPQMSQDTTTSATSGPNLRKQPTHSTYTSEVDDRHDVFDKNVHSATSSDYSNPTNYSAHTGRSWASPKRKSVHEVQKEINRRSQDMSQVLGSPTRERPAKAVPVAKDFSIDFIAKALEDLNAGGDGDMTKFRRSVRETPSDLVDDSQETATRFNPESQSPTKTIHQVNQFNQSQGQSQTHQYQSQKQLHRQSLPQSLSQNLAQSVSQNLSHSVSRPTQDVDRHDSISFRKPDPRRRTYDFSERRPAETRQILHETRPAMPDTRSSEDTDEASMNTIVRSPERRERRISQSPTKSYVNLRPFVENTTPGNRPFVTKAVAKYSYNAREQGELSFRKGWQLYVVHKQEDNWYVCELGDNCGTERGSVGLAPYNYLVEGDHVF